MKPMAICEVWCSPLRQEIYQKKVIVLDTEEYPIEDEINTYLDPLGDIWYDVFGEEYRDMGGLYKVVLNISFSVNHYYDWEGIPDCDVEFETQTLFKSKCSTLTELKIKWLEILGPERSERYMDRVFKI